MKMLLSPLFMISLAWPRWTMKSCYSSSRGEKEQRGLCILGTMASTSALACQGWAGFDSCPFQKAEEHTPNTPSQPLDVLQSQARKRQTTEKYLRWLCTVFAAVWKVGVQNLSMFALMLLIQGFLFCWIF